MALGGRGINLLWRQQSDWQHCNYGDGGDCHYSLHWSQGTGWTGGGASAPWRFGYRSQRTHGPMSAWWCSDRRYLGDAVIKSILNRFFSLQKEGEGEGVNHSLLTFTRKDINSLMCPPLWLALFVWLSSWLWSDVFVFAFLQSLITVWFRTRIYNRINQRPTHTLLHNH